MYGRTPYASWGVIPLLSDVMDLFIEDIQEENGTTKYLDPVSEKYEPCQLIEDTIKVRFGSDVKVTHQVTRNGIILPKDLVDNVNDYNFLPFINHYDIGYDKAFSIAWILDPILTKKMGVDIRPTNFAQQRQFAIENINLNAKTFVKLLKKWNPFGMNIVFALL